MSTFSERLKEERLRLGLSQTALAKKVGIHRNTQIKYESGDRYPDTEYIVSIGEIGIDVSYLWSGIRSEEKELYDCASYELRDGVYEHLGFTQEEIKKITFDLARLIDSEYLSGGACDTDEWKKKRAEFVNTMLFHVSIDIDLLSSVIDGIEGACVKLGEQLFPSKKAHAAAMLYRAFKASGKVDQKMIAEAVKLAAG